MKIQKEKNSYTFRKRQKQYLLTTMPSYFLEKMLGNTDVRASVSKIHQKDILKKTKPAKTNCWLIIENFNKNCQRKKLKFQRIRWDLMKSTLRTKTRMKIVTNQLPKVTLRNHGRKKAQVNERDRYLLVTSVKKNKLNWQWKRKKMKK